MLSLTLLLVLFLVGLVFSILGFVLRTTLSLIGSILFSGVGILMVLGCAFYLISHGLLPF